MTQTVRFRIQEIGPVVSCRGVGRESRVGLVCGRGRLRAASLTASMSERRLMRVMGEKRGRESMEGEGAASTETDEL